MTSNSRKGSGEKLIATNPNAKRNFHIEEVVEAGIALQGTEIKSLRNQSPNLNDAFAEISGKRGSALEAWLVNAHIAPYTHGNIWNHEPLRRRKLLLHRHQIDKMFGAITQKGYTVVPTRMYFKDGYAKVELGLGRGKTKGDKRDSTKKRDAQREMDQARKKSNRSRE
jgi:SsrA-binding protein